MLNIRCTIKDTGRINSKWNKSLDGLTGTIFSADNSAWGGYCVRVLLDQSPEWMHGRNDIYTYVGEDYRDLIAVVSDEDFETIRLHCKGITLCECGAQLPDHYEGCSRGKPLDLLAIRYKG